MGTVAVASLGVVALLKGELSALLVLVSGFGVLLAALYYGFSRPASAHGINTDENIPRAKELVGDIGTYSIGALIAIAAIIGGFVLAAVIVLVPYFPDLGLRARGHSLSQLIAEPSVPALSLVLIRIEALFGVVAIASVYDVLREIRHT